MYMNRFRGFCFYKEKTYSDKSDIRALLGTKRVDMFRLFT